MVEETVMVSVASVLAVTQQIMRSPTTQEFWKSGLVRLKRWRCLPASAAYPPSLVYHSIASLHCNQGSPQFTRWTLYVQDLPRTFPGHPSLDEDGRNILRRLLTAYARHNPSVGYCQVHLWSWLGLLPDSHSSWTCPISAALSTPPFQDAATLRSSVLMLASAAATIPGHNVPFFVWSTSILQQDLSTFISVCYNEMVTYLFSLILMNNSLWQAMNFLAALLLLLMPEENAFWLVTFCPLLAT